MSVGDVLREYPQLEEADVRACIAYGAEMARERYIDVPGGPRFVKFKLDGNFSRRAGERTLLRRQAISVQRQPRSGPCVERGNTPGAS